jgi:phosphate transport system substrate-binding protein
MRRRPVRSAAQLAALLVMALLAMACGDSDDPTASTDTPAGGAATTQERLSATLNGSGATFPKSFYEVAIAGYQKVQPGVTVNYAGGGSGTGRQNLQDGVVDFAGSDGLVKDADRPKYKGEFLYIPTVSAPITVSYNLADVKDLTLDADTIAKIFQRQIKKWDDPAIAALNSGAKMPSTDITVAHRSDGSGTTENFTLYLVSAAPNTWTLKSGSTVEWPADTQAGNGNQGVAQIVKSTAGAVGYVDLSDATASGLQFAKVKNKAGKAVVPSVESTTAALDGAEVKPDLSYNPLNAAGEGAYPITAPTWILVYKNQTDKAKGEALKSFLRYMVTDGQKLAKDVDYAPLPTSLQQKTIAQIDSILVPSP